MRRVVVTGLGAVSPLGSKLADVETALRESRSGLVFSSEMSELGFKCHVFAPVRGFNADRLDRREALIMPSVAKYSTIAGLDALADAGMAASDLPSERTSVVIGTGMGGAAAAAGVEHSLRESHHPLRSGANGIVRMLNSGCASHLAAHLGTHGRTYSLSSACATGVDAIGHGYELVAHGVEDVCLAGAAEENSCKHMGVSFDNWGALPSAFNDRPAQACRPYDVEHGGFVMGFGAGIVILEEYERAKRRGATIYAEIVGYGSSNDGADMFHPTGQGAKRATLQALASAGEHGVDKIDYLNPHGASTPIGDGVEVAWIRDVFAQDPPSMSSTKGLAGHAMSAAGALEAIYTLIMMHEGFVAPTANLERVAPDCEGVPHVREYQERPIQTALTTNAGLGGANGSLIFRQV